MCAPTHPGLIPGAAITHEMPQGWVYTAYLQCMRREKGTVSHLLSISNQNVCADGQINAEH
eukprot:6200838-Pleurochrysis_carterae.AAC.1